MLQKEIGNVLLLTRKATGFSVDILALAERLKDCYTQKTPWKGYSELRVEDDEFEEDSKYLDPEEVKSIDYVERIWIDTDKNTIIWGQGDFTVGCSLKDLEITERSGEFENGKHRGVKVGVRAGGYLIYNEEAIYITREDGFIGDMIHVQTSKNSWSGHIENEIEPILVLDREVSDGNHEDITNFDLDCLALVDRATIWTNKGNKEHLNKWAVGCGYKNYEELLADTCPTEETLKQMDCVMYGQTDKIPDKESLTYWHTVEVAYIATQGVNPELSNTIDFVTRAVFTDKNNNWWVNGQI